MKSQLRGLASIDQAGSLLEWKFSDVPNLTNRILVNIGGVLYEDFNGTEAVGTSTTIEGEPTVVENAYNSTDMNQTILGALDVGSQGPAIMARNPWSAGQNLQDEAPPYLQIQSREPGFFENLGHSNLILTAGGGSYGHVDGPACGATSLRQAVQCWRTGADALDFAKEHREFARAFESFPADADRIYPGWRQALDVG